MKLPKNKFKILCKKRFPCRKETQYWQDKGMPQGGVHSSTHQDLLVDFRLISNFLILPPNTRAYSPPKGKALHWPGRGINGRIGSVLLKNVKIK